MEKIKAAVVGYGNIGQYAVQALQAAEDFQLVGVIRRSGATLLPRMRATSAGPRRLRRPWKVAATLVFGSNMLAQRLGQPSFYE